MKGNRLAKRFGYYVRGAYPRARFTVEDLSDLRLVASLECSGHAGEALDLLAQIDKRTRANGERGEGFTKAEALAQLVAEGAVPVRGQSFK